MSRIDPFLDRLADRWLSRALHQHAAITMDEWSALTTQVDTLAAHVARIQQDIRALDDIVDSAVAMSANTGLDALNSHADTTKMRFVLDELQARIDEIGQDSRAALERAEKARIFAHRAANDLEVALEAVTEAK